ncbi:MAG: type II secretion system F family protein [Verrucomicrobiota bacterium]
MNTFAYTALDLKGKTCKGKICASNADEARRLIKQQRMFPLQMQTTASTTFFLQKKLSLYRLAHLTRQLATLTDSGIPLTRSMHIALEQERHALTSQLLRALATSLEHGNSFSESLAQHSATFDPLYIGMIKTGEKSGRLPLMLLHLAEFFEKNLKIRRKIISVLIYPSIVLSMTGGVFILLFTFLVPRFQSVFANLIGNRPLPWMTQMLFDTANFFQPHIFSLGFLTIAILVILAIVSRLPRTALFFDILKLRTPLWATFYKKVVVARFAHTLSILTSSGIPLLSALKIIQETTANQLIIQAIARVMERIKEGESVSVALRATGIFPPIAVGMIQIGEETGKLPDMLQKIASIYDEETESAASFFTAVLEPALIIFLALIVITIIIALFTPLITLITELATGF